MQELSPVSGKHLAGLLNDAINLLDREDVDHPSAYKALLTFLNRRTADASVVDLTLSDFKQAGSKWIEDTFTARVSGLNAYLREVWFAKRVQTADAALRPAAVEIEGAPRWNPQYRFVWVEAERTLRGLRVQRDPGGHVGAPMSIAEGEILRGSRSVVDCNISIANEATEILIATGSRSRDPDYLKAIEQRLEKVPQLVHYRVLFGPPHKQVLKEHLQRLLKIRPPMDRPQGRQTLYISMFDSCYDQQEFCLCANEHRALLVLPGLGGVKSYDSGLVVTDPEILQRWHFWARELYWAAGEKGRLETVDSVKGLHLLHELSSNQCKI